MGVNFHFTKIAPIILYAILSKFATTVPEPQTTREISGDTLYLARFFRKGTELWPSSRKNKHPEIHDFRNQRFSDRTKAHTVS